MVTHWLSEMLLPYLWTACSITRGRIFPFQQTLLHFPGWMDPVSACRHFTALRHFTLCVLVHPSPRPNPSCVSSGQWFPTQSGQGGCSASFSTSSPRTNTEAMRPSHPSLHAQADGSVPRALLGCRVPNCVHRQNNCHSRSLRVQEGC